MTKIKAKSEIKLLLDLGLQPISNRYLKNPVDEEKLFPLKLGQCQKTGLIQLIDPVHPKELNPKYDWLTYNEPEGHLDEMVKRILDYFPKDKSLKIGGVSIKDVSTLECFEKLGCGTWMVDLERDLLLESHLGFEAIHAAINKSAVDRIIKRNGKSNLIIARQIFEHVYNLKEFLESLKSLIYDDGYILFEIPDCTTSLENFDYTMTWEEHLIYLTPNTFKHLLRHYGFTLILYHLYPYPHESSLVVLVRKNISNDNSNNPLELDKEICLGDNYANNFFKLKNLVCDFISKERKKGKIVLFGAGQDTCAFLNYFDVSDQIDYVIDDNINKTGLFMPKSKTPIVSSEVLENKNISLCLLSLNPINEEKVIAKLKKFKHLDGRIHSIFPHSKYSFLKE